ncbi:MAG: cytochrome c biogenesis protein CcsA [Pseudomonadota bacterium]
MAVFWGAAAIIWHAWLLWSGLAVTTGLALSLGNTASFIGLQLAVIAALGAGEATLRGLSGGLLVLAGVCGSFTGIGSSASTLSELGWQIQAHVLISLFAYGLLTVGAIVSVYALVQDRRLRTARLSPVNQLFAPLETTEKLLFGVTSSGFLILLLAVFSGLAFVENLFAQHLVHKTVLSLLALLLFGVLLAGRQFAGWRGRRAVYLYLWGFVVLWLAYFGSRYILEALGRSWG